MKIFQNKDPPKKNSKKTNMPHLKMKVKPSSVHLLFHGVHGGCFWMILSNDVPMYHFHTPCPVDPYVRRPTSQVAKVFHHEVGVLKEET